MKASEFVNVFATAMVKGMKKWSGNTTTFEELERDYNNNYFYLPRIRCNDGFSISIQVHNGNYCASENGTRQFGFTWREVEWGFPSEEIDGVKYNAEDENNITNTVGGYVDINLIDELIEEHGGLNLEETLKGLVYSNE